MRKIKRGSPWVAGGAPALAALMLMAAPRVISSAPRPAPQASPIPNAGPFTGDLYITTFIDVVPQYTKSTLDLCNQYKSDSANDPGLVRFEVLSQWNGRENHVMLLIVWKTLEDYTANMAKPATKAFREKLLPYLGAPFDERISHQVPRG